ncbi:hypothetical protein E2562_023241, partial [Oryza meyeriana var. granulata]
ATTTCAHWFVSNHIKKMRDINWRAMGSADLVSEFFCLLPLVKANSTQFMICGTGATVLISQREIPSSNIDLHSVHCARNLQKCGHCGEMVARKLMDEHYNENHAPVNCTLCKEIVAREIWDLHKSEQCPQRIVACEYCEFELPAVELHEHQDVCGNRTEFCQTCKKYIRLREWTRHEIQCHANANGSAQSS